MATRGRLFASILANLVRDPQKKEGRVVSPIEVPLNGRQCRSTLAVLPALFFVSLTAFGQSYEHLSPFTRVEFRADGVEVDYDGRTYDLLAVNDVAASEMIAFCKRYYRDYGWEAAFATRMVEVLTRMGHRPSEELIVEEGTPVKLELREGDSGRIRMIESAPLNGDNVRALRRAYDAAVQAARHQRDERRDPDGWQRSPFSKLELSGDRIVVELQNQSYILVSIDGISSDQLLEHTRRNWRTRSEEMLSGYLGRIFLELGRPLAINADVKLRDPQEENVQEFTQSGVTRENAKRALNEYRRRRSDERLAAATKGLRELSPEQMLQRMVDNFEAAIERSWAYREANDADFKSAIQSIRTRLDAGLSPIDCIIELRKIVALGIDGHADSKDVLPGGYLPFRLDASNGQFVAVRFDRSDFAVPDHPYVASIDGIALPKWQEAALDFINKGSSSYVQRQLADDMLPRVQFLRSRLGLEERDAVDVEFTSEDGTSTKTLTFPIKESPELAYEKWPMSLDRYQGESSVLPGNIGYFRIDSMYGEPRAFVEVNETMKRFRDMRGMIIDVRGNTGGGPEVLHALLPYLMAADESPYVVTAAKYRLGADYDPDFPGRLSRGDSPDWNPQQRQAIDRFRRMFRPQWEPPDDEFSQWYYEVVERSDNPQAFHYNRPVVVLQDEQCFSATDVLLSALKGRSNVTLVGTPSAGGSGDPQVCHLLGNEVTCILSTYAGFQPNGQLFDGNGIQPDVIVYPTPDYFIGKRDKVLDKALQLLEQG